MRESSRLCPVFFFGKWWLLWCASNSELLVTLLHHHSNLARQPLTQREASSPHGLARTGRRTRGACRAIQSPGSWLLPCELVLSRHGSSYGPCCIQISWRSLQQFGEFSIRSMRGVATNRCS